MHEQGGPEVMHLEKTDLATPEAKDVVFDLVKWCDVLTESFSPRAMANWGFSYDELKKVNPELIMFSSCLMGQTGPMRLYAGFGTMAAAIAGLYPVTGWPDRIPAGPFTAYPGDGSEVTYYWYRFADQPSMLNADLTDGEREEMQLKVEKIHREWTKDKEYLAPPTVGALAEIDSALIVMPPEGLEVGYVPIVTRQGLKE